MLKPNVCGEIAKNARIYEKPDKLLFDTIDEYVELLKNDFRHMADFIIINTQSQEPNSYDADLREFKARSTAIITDRSPNINWPELSVSFKVATAQAKHGLPSDVCEKANKRIKTENDLIDMVQKERVIYRPMKMVDIDDVDNVNKLFVNESVEPIRRLQQGYQQKFESQMKILHYGLLSLADQYIAKQHTKCSKIEARFEQKYKTNPIVALHEYVKELNELGQETAMRLPLVCSA